MQDGVVVMDVFNREALMRKVHSEKSGRLEYPSFLLLQKRRVSLNGKRLCDLWEVCDKTSGKKVTFEHVVRLYKVSKLQSLFTKAGFVVKSVYGGYEGENLSSNSLQLILIAVKK
jgi:aminopeptidase C